MRQVAIGFAAGCIAMCAAGCGANAFNLSPAGAAKIVRQRMAAFSAELSTWREFPIPSSGIGAPSCHAHVSKHAIARAFREFDYPPAPAQAKPTVQVDVAIFAFPSAEAARTFARRANAPDERACLQTTLRRHYERELHRPVAAATTLGLPAWLRPTHSTIDATLLRLSIPGKSLNSQRFIFDDHHNPQVDYDLVIVKTGRLPRSLTRRLLAIGGR